MTERDRYSGNLNLGDQEDHVPPAEVGQFASTAQQIPEQVNAATSLDTIDEEKETSVGWKKVVAVIGGVAVFAAGATAAAVFYLKGEKDAAAPQPGLGDIPVATAEPFPSQGGSQPIETPTSTVEIPTTTPEQAPGSKLTVGKKEYTVEDAKADLFTVTKSEAPGASTAGDSYLTAVQNFANAKVPGGTTEKIALIQKEGLLAGLDSSATTAKAKDPFDLKETANFAVHVSETKDGIQGATNVVVKFGEKRTVQASGTSVGDVIVSYRDADGFVLGTQKFSGQVEYSESAGGKLDFAGSHVVVSQPFTKTS